MADATTTSTCLATETGLTKAVESVNVDQDTGAVTPRNSYEDAAPPPTLRPVDRPGVALNVRASSLGDRLELYRAERDTLDKLREKDQEAAPKEHDPEEVMGQVIRDFQRLLIPARLHLAEVFTSFDKDGDGTVTVKEFQAGLRALNVNVADDTVELLVQAMDRDGDGEIDYREFTKQFADKGGQFSKTKEADNLRFLSADDFDDAIRGFQQVPHVRNEGTVQLLYRWSLNVDVLHGLTREERYQLMDNIEVVHVKAGQDIVHAGSVGTATTFFIVLSGTCCIWLPPLDSNAFAEASIVDKPSLSRLSGSNPAARAQQSARRWIQQTHDVHSQSMKLAELQRMGRQRMANVLADSAGATWAENTADSVEKQRRHAKNSENEFIRKAHAHSPKLFESLQSKKPKRVYSPGTGFKYVGKHSETAREHCETVAKNFHGIVKDTLEAHKRRMASDAADPQLVPVDELMLASKATKILGERELAANHVEMRFDRFSSFGEHRAMYNADHVKVLRTGAQTVQMTVRATTDADVKLLAVYRQEDIVAIERAHHESMQDKVRFLRGMPQYKDKSEAEITKLATYTRRTWAHEGDTIVKEGEKADSVYFVVSGQLSVTKTQPDGTEKIVNVLGAGASLGQVGVVEDGGRRTATCSARTDCEMLYIHKYNFIRCSDPEEIRGIRNKLAEIARRSGDLTKSAAETQFLTGRSTGLPANTNSKSCSIAGFHAIKLSEIKRRTSVDVRLNENPLLPTAGANAEEHFHALTPTKKPWQATVAADGSSTTAAAIIVEEDAGQEATEGQEIEDQARVAGTLAEGKAEVGTPSTDRSISSRQEERKGQEQARRRRRPKTAATSANGRTADMHDSRSSPTRRRAVSARANGSRKGQRLRSPGLTVEIAGQGFDRLKTGPWSAPCGNDSLSPSPSPSPGSSSSLRANGSSGGWQPTTAQTLRGMAASPKGTFLFHRLRGLATTRRLSSLPTSTSPRLEGDIHRHTSRLPRRPELGGGKKSTLRIQNSRIDKLVWRVHTERPDVQLFPWGVSPDSPRGKLIVHESRLPQ